MKKLQTILTLIYLSFAYCQAQDLSLVIKTDGLRKAYGDNKYSATVEEYYDKKDKLIYEICKDDKGNLEDTPDGIAVRQYIYDTRGNLIERRYYNQDRKLPINLDAPPIVKFEYNQLNQKIKSIYCDEKGKPLKNGFVMITYCYNEKGLVSEKKYLDAKGALLNGMCITRYFYDAKNRLIEESLYDKNEQLVTDEPAITKYSYTSKEKVQQITYYNHKKELIEGECRIEHNYGKRPTDVPNFIEEIPGSEWIEKVFYDKNGKEIRRYMEYEPNLKK